MLFLSGFRSQAIHLGDQGQDVLVGELQEFSVVPRVVVVRGHEQQLAPRLAGAVHVVADLDEAVRGRIHPVADGG